MNAGPVPSHPEPDPRLRELAAMLREATGESPAWAAGITPDSRLEDDLQLDSMELAALDDLLRRRYGHRVDLSGHLAVLDPDQLIALSVGDVLAYLATTSGRGPVR